MTVSKVASALACAAVLALGGCAQTRWDRPDTSQDAAKADLVQCRDSARQEAFRQSAIAYPGFPPFGFRAPYDEFLWRPDYLQWEADQRFYLEGRLSDYCMHNKGYQRVQVQPPA
jgi:hypothetical protein